LNKILLGESTENGGKKKNGAGATSGHQSSGPSRFSRPNVRPEKCQEPVTGDVAGVVFACWVDAVGWR